MDEIKKYSDECKKHIDNSYQLFLTKYKRRAINVSKKKIDQLYETTNFNLKKEENEYKNKQNKYAIFHNDEMRKSKFMSELDAIIKNNDKQMRIYIDEKYIHSMMAGDDEEIVEKEQVPLLLQTNKIIFQTDDGLAEIIGGKKI